MKQVLVRKGRAVVERVPAPQVEPGCLLVRVAFSCVSSGTELSGIRSSGTPLVSRALEKPSRIFKAMKLVRDYGLKKTHDILQNKVLVSCKPTGYSAAGVVVGVAPDVDSFLPGDRVACAGNQCAHHAEYICVPKNLAVRVPDAVDLADASTVALGAIAIQGIRRAAPTLGETVVVIGLGLLGQLTAQLLRANGCRVIGTDVNPQRIELALANGMHDGVHPGDADLVDKVLALTGGRGADAVLVTASTASNEVVSRAFQMSRQKGRVVVVGDVGLNLRRRDLYAKEADLLISCSYGPGRYDDVYEGGGRDYPFAYVRWTENRNMTAYLDLVARGALHLKPLVSSTVPIEEADEAFRALLEDKNRPLLTLLSYSPPEEPTPSMQFHAAAKTSGRVRIAVVGAGGFAKSTLLPLLKELADHYEVRTVVSRSGANAMETAKKFNVPTASTSFADVLQDPDIDAILIATRHHLHGTMALAGLQASKHVFVEKPLALAEPELLAIEEFYAEGGGSRPLVMTGFNRRFSRIAERLKSCLSDRGNPMLIQYRMNAGYRPADSWLHGPEGGGRNRGEACHIYDLFNFLTDARVAEIDYAAVRPATDYYRSDDNFVCTVRYDDGSVASLLYTALGSQGFPKEQMEVFCDGWVAAMNDYKSLRFAGKKCGDVCNRVIDKGHREELQAFAEAVLHGNAWPIPLWQQAQATRISFGGPVT